MSWHRFAQKHLRTLLSRNFCISHIIQSASSSNKEWQCSPLVAHTLSSIHQHLLWRLYLFSGFHFQCTRHFPISCRKFFRWLSKHHGQIHPSEKYGNSGDRTAEIGICSHNVIEFWRSNTFKHNCTHLLDFPQILLRYPPPLSFSRPKSLFQTHRHYL